MSGAETRHRSYGFRYVLLTARRHPAAVRTNNSVNVLGVDNYACVRFLAVRPYFTPPDIAEQARHIGLVEEHSQDAEAVPEGAVECWEERMPE